MKAVVDGNSIAKSMSTRHWLAASLSLNLCLLGTDLYLIEFRPAASVSTLGSAAPSSAELQIGSENRPSSVRALDWSQLASEDYHVYIANLRATGCPEGTLRDIIVGEVNRLYAPKLAAARASAQPRNYWQEPQPWGHFAQERMVNEQINTLLKELLDVDFQQEAGDRAAQEWAREFGFLTPEKAKHLHAIEDKYSALEGQILVNARGLTSSDDESAMATLRREKVEALEGLLTPEERLEYDFRTSSTAQRLRMQLAAFQPTEAEFRAIYQAVKAKGDQANAPHDPNTPAQHEFEDQLKTALGDQRYADYQRSQDPGYQNLVRIADRYGLMREVATQVWDLKQGVTAETQQVMAIPSLTPDQRQAELQAVRAQTEQALTSLLGEQAYNLYRDRGGSWVQQIVH